MEVRLPTGCETMSVSKMVVCDACHDYSYRSGGEPGTCSTCAEYGRESVMRWATPEEQCTACSNLHRSDFQHTCGRNAP